MASGYIKTFRQIEEWEWYQDANTFRVFMHCLIRANYEEKKWRGESIEVGSFITSSLKMAEELKLSRQQIRTALANLQSTNEITIKSTNKYIIVCVRNWRKYQSSENEINQQDNHRESENVTINQPSNNHNEEIKEIKNKEIEEIKERVDGKPSTARFVPPTVDEVRIYCEERKNKVDPQVWHDFYSSKGWMVGSNKMKDWKAAVRTWEKQRDGKTANGKPAKPDIEVPWLDGYLNDLKTKGENA